MKHCQTGMGQAWERVSGESGCGETGVAAAGDRGPPLPLAADTAAARSDRLTWP